MNRMKTCSLVLALVFLVSFVAGCGGGTPGAPAAKVLKVTAGPEPDTLDPRKSMEIPIIKQMYEGLCSIGNQGEIVPGVAEKWEVSPDGLKYRFILRANAKWSNGEAVTAHDFEYAWKSTLSPELACHYAAQLFPIKGGEAYNKKNGAAAAVGVKALDDRTLEVTLENPTPYFLLLTTFPTYFPVNNKLVAANDKWASDVSTLVSNGPFKITGWIHQAKVELAKNDNYWDKNAVKVDKVEFALTDQATTALNMFENNQVDMMLVSPPASQIPRLMSEKKLTLSPYVGHYHYLFNCKPPPLDNVKVRKALAYAIDRKAIIDTLVRGGEKAAMSWVPWGLPDITPGSSDFRTVGGEYFKDNDVETAKKLLAEAGYPDGKGFPEISLLYNTNENHKAIVEALQEMWKKNLGINVKLVNQEWKVYLQSCYEGNFEIARRGWIGDYLDPMTAMETMLGDNSNNNSNWKNPEYDRLVKEAQKTLDNQKRMQLMHDAEKILLDDMPILPLYYMNQHNCIKPYVKGYYIDGLGNLYLKGASIEK